MFQPRRYLVAGTQPVLDHAPGDVFEADIPPVQEQRLLDSGALSLVRVDEPPTLPPLDIEPPNPEPEEEALNG